jgi:hypothetical protein
MNQYPLPPAAAAIAIGHEPPETTPPVDDEDVEDVELGVCVGDWRLEVDEPASLDVEVDVEDEVVLVSDDPDAVVEFEFEFELELELEDDEVE